MKEKQEILNIKVSNEIWGIPDWLLMFLAGTLLLFVILGLVFLLGVK